MRVLYRLYRFHRRSGMTRRRALSRAWDAVARDINLTRGPTL
jgi:hypothetical protein